MGVRHLNSQVLWKIFVGMISCNFWCPNIFKIRLFASLFFRILRIAITHCISRTQLKNASLAGVSTQHFYKSVPICLGLNIYKISFFLPICHSLTHFFFSHCIPFFTSLLYFNSLVTSILSISSALPGGE